MTTGKHYKAIFKCSVIKEYMKYTFIKVLKGNEIIIKNLADDSDEASDRR